MSEKPALPANPNFGSGPCTKRPGYSLDALKDAALGRSHRSALGKGKLAKAIAESKRVLGVPDDYLLGITPASDTGAFEMAMWSMLGARGVDVFHWESFGAGWLSDIKSQLRLDNVREFSAPYGQLPDLSQAEPANDVVFAWNGTTSGVRVPNADWLQSGRDGLVLCDATSAVFAMDMPWAKLDVVTYSWQKVLGGEGAHGVIILSPRAVARLESYKPTWPMPKIFRMTKAGKLMKEIFDGSVINTPSMLCVEDYLDALQWADSLGGLPALVKRAEANLAVFSEFCEKHAWISFLPEKRETRSCTSMCFKLDLPEDKVKQLTALLGKEKAAYDIGSYRDAPAGIRVWGGATVETSDLVALTKWLEWAYAEVKKE